MLLTRDTDSSRISVSSHELTIVSSSIILAAVPVIQVVLVQSILNVASLLIYGREPFHDVKDIMHARLHRLSVSYDRCDP